jgi:hypothetical protein
VKTVLSGLNLAPKAAGPVISSIPTRQTKTKGKHMTIKFSRIPTILLFAGMALTTLTSPASAQKAALTKDVDQPGRNPYQQTVGFNPSANLCPNGLFCSAVFNKVPANYRLVVTHISASYGLTAGGSFASVGLGSVMGGIFGNQIIIPAISTGPNSYIASSPVTFYVEPGDAPTLFISGQFINNSVSIFANVVGYLVALP